MLIKRRRGGLRHLLGAFCDDTANPSFYRIGDIRRRVIARSLWMILFLMCLVSFSINMAFLLQKYLQYPKTDFAVYQRLFIVMLQRAGIFKAPFDYEESEAYENYDEDMGVICGNAKEDSVIDTMCNGLELCDEDYDKCFDFANDEYVYDNQFDSDGSSHNRKDADYRRRKREIGYTINKTTTEAPYESDEYYEYDYEEEAESSHTSTPDEGYDYGYNNYGYKEQTTTLSSEMKKYNNLGLMQLVSKAVRDSIFLLHQSGKEHERKELFKNNDKFKEQFIKACSYNLKRCGPEDFTKIDTNYFGSCYSFNYDGKVGNSSKPGPLFGLRLLLDVDQEEYLTTTDTAGVKVSIHDHYEFPFPETTAYNAMTEASTSIRMKRVVVSRLGRPYGMCVNKEEALDETDYDYNGNYTTDGCFYTCISRRVIQKCKCVHYMYPLPKRSHSDTGSNYTYCGREKKSCAENEEEKLLNNQTITPLFCGCYDLCRDNTYQTTISQTAYPSAMFHSLLDTDAEGYEPKTNVVHLEVFYETLNYQVYQERGEYAAIQLLSDFGGLIGLWLGICMLSLVEFLSLFASLFLYVWGCINHDFKTKEMEDEAVVFDTPKHTMTSAHRKSSNFRILFKKHSRVQQSQQSLEMSPAYPFPYNVD